MLTYHQAFDISHCLYRFIAIGLYINRPIVIDQLRIYDFYFVFPGELPRNVQFPQGLTALKNDLKAGINPYEDVMNVRTIFKRMKPYHDLALRSLASYGMISVEKLESKFVTFNYDVIPKDIRINARRLSDQQRKTLDVLEQLSRGLEFRGDKGFIDRTSLIDTRYAN